MSNKEATLLVKIKTAGEKALGSLKSGFDSVRKAANEVALGAAAVGAAVFAAGAKAISAFKTQEESVNRLNQALINTGDFTAEASKDMQAFSAELQKNSTFGDEIINNQLALAKSFGVSNDEAKKLVQAAADLSAATGMELSSAVKNLGKTMAGLTGELGESVPALRNLTAEQLKAGEGIDLVANQFSGSAKAMTQGLGALDQMANAVGDLWESVGQTISPIVSLAAQALTDLAVQGQNATGFMNGLSSVVDFVAIAFIRLKNGVMVLGETLGTGLAASIQSVSLAFSGEFTKAKQVAMLGMEEVKNVVIERAKTQDDELAAISAAREEKEAAQRERELAMVEQSEARKTEVLQAKESERQVALLEQRILEEEDRIARQELELQMLGTHEQAKIDLQLAYLNQKLTNEKNAEKKLALERQKAHLLEKKELTELDKFRAFMNSSQVTGKQQTFRTISGLARSENKELAAIGKAAAIVDIGINTARGIGQALGAFPPPISFIMAGLVGAAGAAQIAEVSRTQLADGGIVQASQGGTPAIIGEGGRDEAVIPLDDFSGAGFGSGVHITVYGGLLGDEASAREFARAVDRELLALRQNNESVSFDSGVI